MKKCIYVFSGTGTSLAVAKRISDDLENSTIRLIPNLLEESKQSEIKVEASTVGFIFPNYFGSVPEIVLRFIRTLNLENTSYIFAIVTAAGNAGYSFKFLEKELNKKGKTLDYARHITGISNYIVGWYYNIMVKSGKQRIKAVNRIEATATKYAKDIMVKKRKIEKSSYVSYKRSHLLSEKEIIKDTCPWDKEFSIDHNCIGCGICEKVCQFKNIKMDNSNPVFQHNCQRCMACFQYCPQGAIQFRKNSLDKPRYFHPQYPAKKLIEFLNLDRQYLSKRK